jgi:DNA-directed RNA polymerase subunit H (RpoH/RPB5)
VTDSKKDTRIKTFYPLVGSLAEYQRNIGEIFFSIDTCNFTRGVAIQWMMSQYKSSREFCRKLLDMLKAVGLITILDKHYKLTSLSKKYLQTKQTEFLVWAFIEKILGFVEIINILSEKGANEKSALRNEWEARVLVKFSGNQFEHRLNWLRALGYVDVVARHYLLTERGLKLAAEVKQKSVQTSEEKQKVSHQDLEDSIRVIGEFFEFETSPSASINEVLPSYALKLTEGNRRLDCLWVRYIHFGGKIKFPVEIHLGGNLADTTDRLETVSEYVQKAIVITDEEQEKKLLDRLKVKKSRLLDKLVVISVEDVYKAVQATNVLKSLTTKLFKD